MKRLTLIIVLIILTSCQSQKVPNVDVIWEKYLKTVSDRETIANIKTSYQVSESKYKFGVIKTVNTIKAPDKFYSLITFPDNTQLEVILNGKNGITKKNGKTEKLNKQEIELYSELAMIFPEYTYTSKKNDIKYIGKVKENGKTYYKIQIKPDFDDEKSYYLIDNNTFEFYKMVSDKGTVLEVIERQEIMGVKTFLITKQFIKQDTVISKVLENKYNIKVNDSIFKID